MSQSPTKEQIQELIDTALKEDLGSGDITTRTIFEEDRTQIAEIVSRQALVLCGMEIARGIFIRLDPKVKFSSASCKDGDSIGAGEVILQMEGAAPALLEGERTALNLLQKLSGIATLTSKYVDCARPVTILDTRKTTPGLRVFEKYAVVCGGGKNHRFGLFDQVMIKDNHIKAAGGITQAVGRIRKAFNRSKTVEVETTSLEEVKEALAAGADWIMLDNMSVDMIKEAVALVGARARLEASGNMTLERVKTLSTSGVDYISVGALTHSAPAIDISMNFIDSGT